MKKTKTLLTLLAGILLASSFPGCKKYEEGPAISFRSRAERVSNTWKVEKLLVNGADNTPQYTAFTETYTKAGSYEYDLSGNKGSGKWEFAENDTQIKRSGVSGMSSYNLVILKLKESEFWYSYSDGNDTWEFHMIPN